MVHRKRAKLKSRRCGICGLSYSRRLFQSNDAHFESAHPEYWNWFNRWRRTFLLVAIGALAFLVLGDYFAFKARNDYLVLLASAFYFIGMNLIISKWRRKHQQAKRQWKQAD